VSYDPPTLDEITERLARRHEGSLRDLAVATGRPFDPVAVSRAARAPHGMLSAIIRGQALVVHGVHAHIARESQQWFPDSARAEVLAARHGPVWGVTRRPATFALGNALLQGNPGLVVPAGLDLALGGGGFLRTTAAGVIPSAGPLALPVRATVAGAAGNVPAGTLLPLVVPLAGLSTQSAEIAAGGTAGGADMEDVEAWRARILQRIAAPPQGGAAFDYPVWVRNAFQVAHVGVTPGKGDVRITIAMGTRESPRAPNPAEIAAIGQHLGRYQVAEGVRPVTAEVIVVAAALVQVPIRIELVQGDTAPIRAAIAAAIAPFIASAAAIGGVIHPSRLSEAISSARGEYAHRLHQPATAVVALPTELLVPGTLSWGPP
jgi:uncharacterized phage protein gp47/JayE